MLIPSLSLRRGTAAIAGLLAVAILAGGAGIATAGGGNAKDIDPNAASAKPVVAKTGAPDAGVPAGLLAQTRLALDELVAGGAIQQDQADAMQARVASGSIDTREVVASGVLDAAQMQRVNDVLVRIKLSYVGP